MKRLTFELEIITPDSYDEKVASSMTLDEVNEEHWDNMDVYLDAIRLTKVSRNIKLAGDARDWFRKDGIYSN